MEELDKKPGQSGTPTQTVTGWFIKEKIGWGVVNPNAILRIHKEEIELPIEWVKTVYNILKKKRRKNTMENNLIRLISIKNKLGALYTFSEDYANKICREYLSTKKKTEWPLLLGMNLNMDTIIVQKLKNI
jgi:hypothetical protein